jgi:hypothetical protein
MDRIITQNHGMGCGVACVAAVTGISYKAALRMFAKPENAWTVGYMCKDLVAALTRMGKPYAYKYLKDKDDPVLKKTGTIVFTHFSKAYPRGHYLARIKGGWMNPWVNFPEIAPARGSIVRKLPAQPIYAVFPTT